MTELEELQRLRALVEQQKLELEKQQVKIEKQQEELEKKDELIRKKEIQIENMIQALLHARKKLFGRSSEVTEGQLCLFETNSNIKQLNRISYSPICCWKKSMVVCRYSERSNSKCSALYYRRKCKSKRLRCV